MQQQSGPLLIYCQMCQTCQTHEGLVTRGEGLSEELAGVGQREPPRDREVAGVQCQEMEYLWRNQMERGSLFYLASLLIWGSLALYYCMTQNLAVVVTV